MILVTGATGFVGVALCAELQRRSIVFRPTSRSARDRHFMTGEVGPDTDWSRALSGIDTVIHLAARVHVMRDTSADPLAEFRRVNVEGTLNFARQFAAAGGRRFVFVSSIKVNGEATEPGQAFSVTDKPDPQDPYGQSKMEAEQALLALGRETGLEIVIIRPPLVYGPGVKANFAAMVRAVRSGVPLPLGAVQNARSLVYVGNLVDLVILASAHPAAVGEIFIAADPQDLSTTDLLHGIGRALGRPARLIPIPPRLLLLGAGLLGRRAVATRLLGNLQVDRAATREKLGWVPPFSFDEAIAETLRH